MSIVPKEVTSGFIEDWHKGVAAGTALELPEYIANRAAQWALEQAAQLCDAQARLDYDAYDLTGNAYSEGAADAADGLATKLRAMMKGGESDGQS